jgi:hypothetical protein
MSAGSLSAEVPLSKPYRRFEGLDLEKKIENNTTRTTAYNTKE